MRGRLLPIALALLAAPAAAADALDAADPPALAGLVDVAASVAAGAGASTGAALGAAGGAAASALAAVGAALAAAGAAVASAAVAAGAALAAAAGALASSLVAFALGLAGLARAHPREAAVAAAATGAAVASAGAAAWLRRFGWGALLPFLPLYSRLAPEDVLANGARASVYELIRESPGAHPRAIAQKLGLGWGTTVYHLGRLEERGLVAAVKRGGMKCYFASGVTPVAERASVAALKHPTAARIAAFVRANPNARQKDVAAALGLSAALVSWHVGKLAEAGVLAKAKDGNATALVVTPAPVAA